MPKTTRFERLTKALSNPLNTLYYLTSGRGVREAYELSRHMRNSKTTDEQILTNLLKISPQDLFKRHKIYKKDMFIRKIDSIVSKPELILDIVLNSKFNIKSLNQSERQELLNKVKALAEKGEIGTDKLKKINEAIIKIEEAINADPSTSKSASTSTSGSSMSASSNTSSPASSTATTPTPSPRGSVVDGKTATALEDEAKKLLADKDTINRYANLILDPKVETDTALARIKVQLKVFNSSANIQATILAAIIQHADKIVTERRNNIDTRKDAITKKYADKTAQKAKELKKEKEAEKKSMQKTNGELFSERQQTALDTKYEGLEAKAESAITKERNKEIENEDSLQDRFEAFTNQTDPLVTAAVTHLKKSAALKSVVATIAGTVQIPTAPKPKLTPAGEGRSNVAPKSSPQEQGEVSPPASSRSSLASQPGAGSASSRSSLSQPGEKGKTPPSVARGDERTARKKASGAAPIPERQEPRSPSQASALLNQEQRSRAASNDGIWTRLSNGKSAHPSAPSKRKPRRASEGTEPPSRHLTRSSHTQHRADDRTPPQTQQPWLP